MGRTNSIVNTNNINNISNINNINRINRNITNLLHRGHLVLHIVKDHHLNPEVEFLVDLEKVQETDPEVHMVNIWMILEIIQVSCIMVTLVVVLMVVKEDKICLRLIHKCRNNPLVSNGITMSIHLCQMYRMQKQILIRGEIRTFRPTHHLEPRERWVQLAPWKVVWVMEWVMSK